MSLKQINSNLRKQNGFTIVELLIVIVVIGILAAITIVSYNGITSRANSNTAKGNAATFLKKAQLFASDTTAGKYPHSAAAIQTASDSGKSFYIPSSGMTLSYSTTALTSSASVSTVRVLKCSAVASTASDTQAEITDVSTGDATISGLSTFVWDYVNNTEVSGGTVGDVTNCPTS